MKRRIILILLVCAGLLSCKSSASDKEVATAVIKGYTTALVQAYKDGNATYLTPFASSEQTSFISLNIMDYKNQNRVFVCRINELKIKDVRKAGSAAAQELLVDTEEDWTFWIEEAGTKALLVPETQIKYRITYHLGKRGNSWLINKLDLKTF